MKIVGVMTRLEDEPGRKTSIIMFVRRYPQLQRVNAVREFGTSLQIRFYGRIHLPRFVISLRPGVPGETRPAERVSSGGSDTAPHEHIGLRGIEIPARSKPIQARIGDVSGSAILIAGEINVSATDRVVKAGRIKDLQL